jgi:TrmH family RNA methyltransferase
VVRRFAAPRSVQRDVDAARRDDTLVVLEGVHALKHGLRFGARLHRVLSPDPDQVLALLARLAPDVVLPVAVEQVDEATWRTVTRGGLPSPSLAVADRPTGDAAAVAARPGDGPVVLLDHPTHLGNVGAVVRVAAAAGADAVLVRGRSDPWHPTAVRGGAGLQFALPVARVEALPATPRPLVAVEPDGAPLGEAPLPAGAVLALGTERGGLSADLREAAHRHVAIPMRPGVSSLNLATAAAVVLYARA